MIFGGAGAIHGPLLSAEIGIGKIIVPRFSSVFCAFGGLVTDLLYDSISPARGEPLNAQVMQSAFEKMRTEAAEWLHKQTPNLAPEYEYTANLRYAGQSFDVPTHLSEDIVKTGNMATLAERFHTEHKRLFMHAHLNRDINAVAYQLRVRGKLPSPSSETTGILRSDAKPESSPGKIFFNGAWYAAPRYRQDTLPGDWSILGPAVIEQVTATTVVPPNFKVSLSKFGDLIMEREN
jgi:N-methylhydantoinase A